MTQSNFINMNCTILYLFAIDDMVVERIGLLEPFTVGIDCDRLQ